MDKLIVTGVDGNFGRETAKVIQKLVPKEKLIFCSFDPAVLEQYSMQGIETHVTNFNSSDGLDEAFAAGKNLLLISMPFVGEKRQTAHKNVIDVAKKAGVRQIVYTSLVNAADPKNPSVEKKDHAYTEEYLKESGLDYIFLRNSQYAEAMITNYFTYVKGDSILKNNQGKGKMAYISRKDCAKAAAYALVSEKYGKKIFNVNGPELLTIEEFIKIGNDVTGKTVRYQQISDEENYQLFDTMGVPRTTEGRFKKDSEAPFSSDGMVTFGQAIREGKMDQFTNDFTELTGESAMTVRYMFEHQNEFQVGERHSKDN